MRLAAALALCLCTAASPGRLDYLGINLSGAEFGVPDGFRHTYLPGTAGTDYIFPTRANIEAAAAAGFNIIRLPFAWERLQPMATGSLDLAYLAGLDRVVHDAASVGLTVILEPANLGYGYGGLVGVDTPASTFAGLWQRLAAHYARTPTVMFGLMNEPHDQSAQTWQHAAQLAVDAVRSTGARQEILVPGTTYTAGATWLRSGNAAVLGAITDPARNIAFEIHQYNDADMSGRSAKPVSSTIGAERLRDVTAWAEAGGHRLFLAEFGAGTDPDSIEAMRNQIAFVQDHRSVWQGAAIWGGGPWWPADYPLAVMTPSSPQLRALAPYMPADRKPLSGSQQPP